MHLLSTRPGGHVEDGGQGVVRVEQTPGPDGYLRLRGPFQPDQKLTLDLELSVQVLEAHPQIRADSGKVCLRRGPLVYCFEAVDNGDNLSALSLDLGSRFETRPASELLPGTLEILAKGWRRAQPSNDEPYALASAAAADQAVELVAVPYHQWGNRGPGEMALWLRR